MTPLPKRRHSTRRSGKREKANLAVKLNQKFSCKKCGASKLMHRACPKCGFYR